MKGVFITLAVLASLFMQCFCNKVYADNGFEVWVDEVKAQALQEGIKETTFERAFRRVRPNKLVLMLDRNQPEFTLSLADYLARVVSPSRIRKGIDHLKKNREVLEKVSAQYGVQSHVLVALWGVETDYGQVMGSFPVIEALATLAYDPRRSDFFRKELLAALHILDEGKVSYSQLEGSWAGAFGGLQFLPSVFRRFAVDFNGDQRIDIWKDKMDLFASGANYLAESGWAVGQHWGREVRLPEGFGASLSGLKVTKTVVEWQGLSVRNYDGTALKGAALTASIVIPDKSANRAFLVYDNYKVLLKWNRSLYYATAVGLLSDLLADGLREK